MKIVRLAARPILTGLDVFVFNSEPGAIPSLVFVLLVTRS